MIEEVIIDKKIGNLNVSSLSIGGLRNIVKMANR